MSSTQVERPVKVHTSCVKSFTHDQDKSQPRRCTINSGIPAPKKNKFEDGRFKFGRKRSQSCSTGNGKFFIPYKKRKREGIVPPTKFLLGGNIFDPLNLNSLQDEEINRAMNAVTPKSSPLPTPKHRKGEVEVLIPPNINDPLNLINCDDDAKYEEQLVSPTKKQRKKKKKKRNSSSSKEDSTDVVNTSGGGGGVADESGVSEEGEVKPESVTSSEASSTEVKEQPVAKEIRDLKKDFELPLKDEEKKGRKSSEDLSKDANKNKIRKQDLKDKIVSPVIPQPGAWKRPLHGHRGVGNAGGPPDGRFNRFRSRGQNASQMPKFQEKNKKFQYGNYNRYYGYRNPAHEIDTRLKYFQRRKELFYDKDVLDIGCNIGHVTLSVARDLGAKSVVGLDIDRSLIEIARANIRHYVNYSESPPNEGTSSRLFPISMPILYGPVDIPGISKSESPSVNKKFPHNVSFVQGNYVLESDVLVQTEQSQFDVILALSITKWIHLNWGDAGLKRAFKRMFAQLRPGGKLILESQAWDSYKKKKNLTETIHNNFNSIEFFPDKFTQYLLSSEVGFSKCEHMGAPFHPSRGFQRPIQLFTKGESPTYSVPSTSNTPFYAVNMSANRVPVYTSVGSTREIDSGSVTPAVSALQHHNSAEAEGTCSHVPVYTPVVSSSFADEECNEAVGTASTSLVPEKTAVKVECGKEAVHNTESQNADTSLALEKKTAIKVECNEETAHKMECDSSEICVKIKVEPVKSEQEGNCEETFSQITEKMECDSTEGMGFCASHSQIKTDSEKEQRTDVKLDSGDEVFSAEEGKSINASDIVERSNIVSEVCRELPTSISSVQSAESMQMREKITRDSSEDIAGAIPEQSAETENMS